MPDISNGVDLILGLGEVGRPLEEVLGSSGRVIGFDVDALPIDDEVRFMHVCYPAEITDFVGVTKSYVNSYRPQVVVVHSTVPVGTCRKVSTEIEVPVVHSPVRGKHVKMVSELRHYAKFIGADDSEVAASVSDRFQAAGMNTVVLASLEATELAKLTETTYFGLQIAFAQDVARMCRLVDVDYDDVVRFYEEVGYLPPVKFFPGVIGGHCVMPNIDLLKKRFDSKLLDAIEWSNKLRIAEKDDR